MSEEKHTNEEGTNIPSKRILILSIQLIAGLIVGYFVFFQLF